jgi:c(7)-type cytochrome triheme protein
MLWKKWIFVRAALFVLIGSTVLGAQMHSSAAARWKPLAKDGIHDPNSPALAFLQSPAEALSVLPPDTAGNLVDWARALREGYISPRTNILPGTEIKLLELDIIMKQTGDLPFVRFPHLTHTEWLDCSNCHEEMFKSKTGATEFSMLDILEGRFCGRCHGAVSFPLTECNRCHSVPWSN